MFSQYRDVVFKCVEIIWTYCSEVSPLQSTDISLYRSLSAKCFGLNQAAVSSNWMAISLICRVTSPPLSFLSGPQIMGFYYVDQYVIAWTHRTLGLLWSHHGPVMLWALHMSHICLPFQWEYRSLVMHTVRRHRKERFRVFTVSGHDCDL